MILYTLYVRVSIQEKVLFPKGALLYKYQPIICHVLYSIGCFELSNHVYLRFTSWLTICFNFISLFVIYKRRLAVFGSSHVRNLSEYYSRHGPVFRVRFFYKPGMKARLIPKDECQQIV